jgi:hypothetical protein
MASGGLGAAAPILAFSLEDAPQLAAGFFTWRGKRFEVEEVLLVWRDYSRRMRMAHNMTERHRLTAESRGSWGVGRFFFRVQTKTGRVFDLYYDRAPDSASDREGHWFLWREMSPTEKEQDP